MREPRRYQLGKDAARIVATGHPWIFRSHLSTAAEVFEDGDWLKLVGPDNKVVGYGVFQKDGLIGIRVFRRGAAAPTVEWFRDRVANAIGKRKNLRQYTDAFRALHGENDGLPGIVLDVYGKAGVLQTYSPAVDGLGRYLAGVAAEALELDSLTWKLPAKRKRVEGVATRILRGTPPQRISIREGKLELTVEIGSGQKSGAFLDLRGLRKWVAAQPWKGLRVLNLFCYTGTLGLAAEAAGAREIWNVDVSQGALDFAKAHHAKDASRHRWIKADVFEWLGKLAPHEGFDVIIVDPPQMASESVQVPQAMRAYKKTYREVMKHLKPGGWLLACCCTSRIPRARFKKEVDAWVTPQVSFVKALQPEDDHPVGFPEGDYLKMNVYRAEKPARK